jgi:hypothetical protein
LHPDQYENPGGDPEKVLPILPGVIGALRQRAFAVKQGIFHLRNRAPVDTPNRYGAAFLQRFQSGGHQFPGGVKMMAASSLARV